jgi:Zn-dependent peptidase ImmA (M78 family)
MELDPLWVWLGKELLNYEPILSSDPHNFKENVQTALLENARSLVKETGQTEPPFDPEPVAKIRKANIVKLPLEHHGMLIPTKGGFTMKINNSMPLVRQRVACAHEIGHTFMYDMESSPPSKAFASSMNRYWVEEVIAYRIAHEILMPEPAIKSYLEQAKSPYIEEFKKIAKLFLVSGEVLSQRIQELKAWNVLILIFEMTDEFNMKLHRTFNCGDKKLNVAKKGTLVKDTIFYNILHKAFIEEENVIIQENVTVLIGNFKKYCHRLGVAYIGNNPTKIITIIPL